MHMNRLIQIYLNVNLFFRLETFLTGNLPSSARLQFLQHKRKIQHLSFCQKRWFYIIFHNFVLEQQRQHNKASHLTDNASMDTIFHEKVRNNVKLNKLGKLQNKDLQQKITQEMLMKNKKDTYKSTIYYFELRKLHSLIFIMILYFDT